MKSNPFDDFWQSSSLDEFNIKEFAAQFNSYDSDNKELKLSYPSSTEDLPSPKSDAGSIAKKRRSQRDFSGEPMTQKELGLVFSSFRAWNGLEHRTYPSAGATYAIETFAVLFNTDSTCDGKIVYYDPEDHSLTDIKQKAPSWAQAKKTLNIAVDGEPNLLIIFVMFPGRATDKYGERGGRFALIEAGAAIQQLALQLAESKKLKGVAVGGILDNVWKQALGLNHTDARIVLGYLVGK